MLFGAISSCRLSVTVIVTHF